MCINESLAKLLGEQGKVGGQYRNTNENDKHVHTIKGIVKDLSYMSPTTPTQPMEFVYTPEPNFDYYFYVDFPIQWKEGTDVRKLEEKLVEKTKQKLYGDDSSVRLMLYNSEAIYEEYLKSEHTLSNLLMLVTAVCVLIAIFGIFSMVSLACERRRREIAIRKVNGAKTGTIIRMFLKEYIYLLLASAVIAFPIGYYLMHLWLTQYAKQAPIYWWIYPAITLAMFALIFLTVIWQIHKAASESPANVMKSE